MLSSCALQSYKQTGDEYYHQAVNTNNQFDKCLTMHKAVFWYETDLTATHDQTNHSRPEYQKVEWVYDMFQSMGCGDLRHGGGYSSYYPATMVAPHAPITYNKPYGAYRPSIIPSDYTRIHRK